MSKTIRVQDDTWERLEQERDWKQTFDQVIRRLLDIRDALLNVEDIVGGQKAYQESKGAGEREKAAAERR